MSDHSCLRSTDSARAHACWRGCLRLARPLPAHLDNPYDDPYYGVQRATPVEPPRSYRASGAGGTPRGGTPRGDEDDYELWPDLGMASTHRDAYPDELPGYEMGSMQQRV